MSIESQASVIRGNSRAQNLVLRLSPMNLPSGANRLPFPAEEQHTMPLLPFTGEPSGSSSGSLDSGCSRSTWSHQRSRTGRRAHHGVHIISPPLDAPFNVSRTPTPPRLETGSPRCNRGLSLSPRGAPRQNPRRSPGRLRGNGARGAASPAALPQSNISIVPESSTTPRHFEGIGPAPFGTTHTPTSVAAVRSRIAVECQ